MRPLLVTVTLLALLYLPALAASVEITTPPNLAPPAQHGITTLTTALENLGCTLQPNADLLIEAHTTTGAPESLRIQRTEGNGKPTLLLEGADARGLMYAALEAADRISWAPNCDDPFAEIRNTTESPYLKERAISVYTMQRAWFEQRLFDEDHWKAYFNLLARSRINSFVVIFGYENGGFMAPLYPYFFDLPEFPDVRLVGITAEQQRRNIAAFKRMIELAHERGIDFVPAPWDHIYRGGVQGGGIVGASDFVGRSIPGLVFGVTTENVAAYNRTAIQKFIELFPEIDGIQFRMHGESGLREDEMASFWHQVFAMIRQARPDIRLDLRAKELPDAIIHDAVDLGLNVRVATKYWMEQQGLPFHPTHINRQNQHDRRHGYADLLKHPRRYQVHWRLWNGGTTRLLLWADPDYVKQFGQAVKMMGGDSFEVQEMLATKMLGEPHDKVPLHIHAPAYRHYRYEFERYWHHTQLWGRLSYNPDTPPETWEREFARRFGASGKPLMQALHLASKVLPRIVASSYRYELFPTTRGWAEMMRIGDLPEYAAAQGSDIQQFQNVADAARAVLDGTTTAMRTPRANSEWFASISKRILELVRQADSESPSTELVTTLTDVRILAHLAAYHSERIRAGVAYNLFRITGDLFSLDDAIEHERAAIEAWKLIVATARDVYSPDVALGVHRVGFPRHWREELENIEAGLRRLNNERRRARRPWTGASRPVVKHVPVRRVAPREPLIIRATIAANTPPTRVHALVDGRTIPMHFDEEGLYQAEVKHNRTEGALTYAIEVDGHGTDPIEVTVTADTAPPETKVHRITKATPGQDLSVSAEVSDRSGVRNVVLRYRNVSQMDDYLAIEMKKGSSSDRYVATIPGAFITGDWDIMYFVEATDQHGNGRMYPDMEKEIPYVVTAVRN